MNHSALHNYLKKREKDAGIKIRVSLLTDTDSFHYNEHTFFDTSSVIKLPIQLLVENRISDKNLTLSEKINILAEDFSYGSGVIAREDTYKKITALPLSEVMKLNIHVSDCIAANMLIRLAGSRENINREFKDILHLQCTELIMDKIDFSEDKRHQIVAKSTTKDMCRLAYTLSKSQYYALTRELLCSSPRSYVVKSMRLPIQATAAKTGTNWWGLHVPYEIINEVGYFSEHALSYAVSFEGKQISSTGKFSALEPKVLSTLRTIFMDILKIHQ